MESKHNETSGSSLDFYGDNGVRRALVRRFRPRPRPPSIDDDIARLRKELIQSQVDAERISQEIDKDKKDFDAYRARTAQRLAQTQEPA